ncbi:MAG: hypothetical protein M4D85_01350 [Actinomycetota bacterium]|nr:hypothetical protein [Actinomycetota bacterium]
MPLGTEAGSALAYWKAVATLPVDRVGALAQLEACFACAGAPGPLNGPYEGRFLTTTVGGRADRVISAVATLWMPWRGKTFDGVVGQGRNRFSGSAVPVMRLFFPGYQGVAGDRAGETTAFRFLTSFGPSKLRRAVRVMRIDYDLPDNPAWPVRRVFDELVTVDEGVFLGQALVHRSGRWGRAAWFSLHTPSSIRGASVRSRS